MKNCLLKKKDDNEDEYEQPVSGVDEAMLSCKDLCVRLLAAVNKSYLKSLRFDAIAVNSTIAFLIFSHLMKRRCTFSVCPWHR